MNKQTKNVFESLKELKKDNKIVYTKDDISTLLDSDTPETKDKLENIYNRSITLIEKYRKNKMNIFQEAVYKKNKSVCDFILSKSRFEKLHSCAFLDIINSDFKEILPLFLKHNKFLNNNEWTTICNKGSVSFINDVIENNNILLKEIKREDFINPLFQFIYSRSDSVKPLTLIKSDLTQTEKNNLWSCLLKYCESVLMHQAIINEDVLPDSLIFDEKPLLLDILKHGNTKIFDFYAKNEFLYKESLEYFKKAAPNLYVLTPYSTKTWVKKLLPFYKEIDISNKNNILPDPQSFSHISSESQLKYFLDILKSDPIFYPFLYKKYHDGKKDIYIDEMFKYISKHIDAAHLNKVKVEIEKTYILSKTDLTHHKEYKKEKRL